MYCIAYHHCNLIERSQKLGLLQFEILLTSCQRLEIVKASDYALTIQLRNKDYCTLVSQPFHKNNLSLSSTQRGQL